MAAETYTACLAAVLVYEGGKVNDPRDPGGRTNQGVTQRVYDAWRKAHGLSARTVYALEPAERDAIYRSGYWDKVSGDTLPAGVDLAVFDPAVNSGPGQALKWYRAAAGAGYTPVQVIDRVCAARLSFLHALRTWKAFGKGWGRRVADVEAKAHRLALGTTPAASAAIAATAQAKAGKAKAAAAQSKLALTGSTAGPAAAATAGGGHHGLLIAILVVGLVAAAIVAFAGWRLSQRATALAAEAAKH